MQPAMRLLHNRSSRARYVTVSTLTNRRHTPAASPTTVAHSANDHSQMTGAQNESITRTNTKQSTAAGERRGGPQSRSIAYQPQEPPLPSHQTSSQQPAFDQSSLLYCQSGLFAPHTQYAWITVTGPHEHNRLTQSIHTAHPIRRRSIQPASHPQRHITKRLGAKYYSNYTYQHTTKDSDVR